MCIRVRYQRRVHGRRQAGAKLVRPCKFTSKSVFHIKTETIDSKIEQYIEFF
eukprot:NODE_10034_length_159_cov_7.854545_g9363_i0.p2 GENE.NODE_10034_length_159_cov_7.854545_g9363_i0~~NODE_10034_length_159_cov_7.854545_g9363_i0.p2  ORF type:complete len:52 (+),score=11.37 NODE_10034_length_159_cov_7.854545_g9363_i0:1-156(+)